MMYEMRTYSGATRTTYRPTMKKTAGTKNGYANVFDRLANYLEKENKKKEETK